MNRLPDDPIRTALAGKLVESWERVIETQREASRDFRDLTECIKAERRREFEERIAKQRLSPLWIHMLTGFVRLVYPLFFAVLAGECVRHGQYDDAVLIFVGVLFYQVDSLRSKEK